MVLNWYNFFDMVHSCIMYAWGGGVANCLHWLTGGGGSQELLKNGLHNI